MMDDGVMWLCVLFPNGRRISLYGWSSGLDGLASKSLCCIALKGGADIEPMMDMLKCAIAVLRLKS